MQKQKKFKLRKTNIFIVYFLVILFSEICFKVLLKLPIFNISLLYIIIFSLGLSLFLSSLNFNSRINKFLFFALLLIIAFVFGLHYCVYKIFSFYFDFSLFDATDQVLDFAKDGFKLVFQNIIGVLIICLPIIICVIFHRYFQFGKRKKLNNLYLLLGSIVCYGFLLLTFNIDKKSDISANKLFYDVNNIELSLKKFGVLHTSFIDFNRFVFGFNEKIEIDNNDNLLDSNKIDNNKIDNKKEIIYDYNNLDIDFEGLYNNETNQNMKLMHQYFLNE